MIIYISIGNSDDKLTQQEWSRFCDEVDKLLDPERGGLASLMLGRWFSLPHEPRQNACWCVRIAEGERDDSLREALGETKRKYRQDSIAFARAYTVFI